MAGTTANKALRYPTGGDTPAFAVDMKKLADDVDAQLTVISPSTWDTGWITLTVTAPNFTAGGIAPAYRRVGSMVSLRGIITRSVDTAPSASWNGTSIFSALGTLSHPATAPIIPTWSGVSGTRPEINVLTDGTIQFRNMGTVTLPAGSNIGLDCVFMAG
jgi:hypothetical protein